MGDARAQCGGRRKARGALGHACTDARADRRRGAMSATACGAIVRMAGAAVMRTCRLCDAAMIVRRNGPMRNMRNRRRTRVLLHGLARAGAAHGKKREQTNDEETTQKSHAKQDDE